MAELDRREFVKTLAVGGAALFLDAAVLPKPLRAAEGQQVDLGQCQSVKITCVSEVGWLDHAKQLAAIQRAGGPKADMWTGVKWDMNNGAGSSALLEVTGLDGSVKRILLDSGWNVPYMTERFEKTGVADLLKQRQIDCLIISHEHYDHFWGLEAALRLDPRVTMVLPATVRAEAADFRQGKVVGGSPASNTVAHTGEVMLIQAGIHSLFPGVGLAMFDLPFNFKIRGEQSLVFNVKDKGLVLVAGCCHQGIEQFADFVRAQVKDSEKLYGFYGGLCTAPLGRMDEKQEWVIRNMGRYGFKTIAANHCTGLPAIQLMKDLRYPVVGGRGKDGSASNLYPGNGDSILFG